MKVDVCTQMTLIYQDFRRDFIFVFYCPSAKILYHLRFPRADYAEK